MGPATQCPCVASVNPTESPGKPRDTSYATGPGDTADVRAADSRASVRNSVSGVCCSPVPREDLVIAPAALLQDESLEAPSKDREAARKVIGLHSPVNLNCPYNLFKGGPPKK